MILEHRTSVEAPCAPANFAESFCIPFLIASQNAGGGWGYGPDSESSVEPTSWALLALGSIPNAADPGVQWLRRTQLPDGSWPAFPGQKQGCWMTALAGLALQKQSASQDRVERGLEWLVSTWPAEGGIWQRLRNWISSGSTVVRQNSSLRGWSWTPGTASWVEPTCYALIFLRSVAPKLQTAEVARRIRLAESMLCDRACPGGGWNSGNPLVYGIAGEPRVGPTAWALLALRNRCELSLLHSSLDWLECAYSQIQSPRSLALAHTCLAAYHRPVAPLEPVLRALYLKNSFLRSVPAVAMAAIALSGSRVLIGADQYRQAVSV